MHSPLTRLVVHAIIVPTVAVLHGCHGVMGAVVLYLPGVELAGVTPV